MISAFWQLVLATPPCLNKKLVQNETLQFGDTMVDLRDKTQPIQMETLSQSLARTFDLIGVPQLRSMPTEHNHHRLPICRRHCYIMIQLSPLKNEMSLEGSQSDIEPKTAFRYIHILLILRCGTQKRDSGIGESRRHHNSRLDLHSSTYQDTRP
ncbi:unnamed protein product [Somion occarium]|uniref:Uncharacterized protein n=1 Tax=Somion occarium TaxID=3059160 RepID=A0ABP1CHW6_9APHY